MQSEMTPALVGSLLARGYVAQALELAISGVRTHPSDPLWRNVHAYALHVSGANEDAVTAINVAISLAPAEAMFRNTLGAIEIERGRFTEAVSSLREAIRLNPAYVEAQFNLSQAMLRQGDPKGALQEIDALLRARPGFFPARLERAKLLIETEEVGSALRDLEDLERQHPANPQVLLNLAAARQRLGQQELASEALDRAVRLPGLAARDLVAASQTYVALENKAAAVDCARRAAAAGAASPEIRGLVGDLLVRVREFAGAREHYAAILARRPDDAATLEKLAAANMADGNVQDAIDMLSGLVGRDGGSRKAHVMLVTAFESLDRFAEARAALARAVEAGHDDAQMLGMLAISRMRACDWSGMDDLVSRLRPKALVPGPHPADPRYALYLDNVTAGEQRLWAENWAAAMLPRAAARRPREPLDEGRRIRVGFLSGELREHPTARLLVGSIEQHDRDRFEFVAYSHRASDRSGLRQRLENAFDRFVDVSALSNRAITEAIRADDIDVLVDLEVYTRNSKFDVMASRPAPLQGHFLGYPGTSGAPFVDFFVSDSVATPPGAERSFSERVLRLPNSCQPNDARRALPVAPSRASCGLPDAALVICCFNQPIKITPRVFGGWCRLLSAIPHAVLWLLQFDAEATKNLVNYAKARGIDPRRLVFAPRVDPDTHTARLQNADIAVDAFPCTSHTGASDLLWAGVPLFTTYGDTFASRMATSILSAGGLADWSFGDLEAPLEAVMALSRDAGALANARHRAAASRATALFDSGRFARDFEALLVEAIQSA